MVLLFLGIPLTLLFFLLNLLFRNHKTGRLTLHSSEQLTNKRFITPFILLLQIKPKIFLHHPGRSDLGGRPEVENCFSVCCFPLPLWCIGWGMDCQTVLGARYGLKILKTFRFAFRTFWDGGDWMKNRKRQCSTKTLIWKHFQKWQTRHKKKYLNLIFEYSKLVLNAWSTLRM